MMLDWRRGAESASIPQAAMARWMIAASRATYYG